jgi:hypothetical protein
MFLQAAVGFVLAMFLREWYLEDLKKISEAQAAEQLQLQQELQEQQQQQEDEQQKNIENNAENIETNNNEQQELNDPKNTAETQEQKNINDSQEKIPETENTVQTENNAETQSNENKINVTENDELNQTDENNEIKNEINVFENANNPSDYQVDEIIDNILSETGTDIPQDIIEQIDSLTPTQDILNTQLTPQEQEQPNQNTPPNNFDNNDNDNVNNQSQNKYDDIAATLDKSETDFDNAINKTENITIDINDLPANDTTDTTQDISQTAIEVLGENFDFDALLADAKVIDAAKENKNITKQDNKHTEQLEQSKSEFESEFEPEPIEQSETSELVKQSIPLTSNNLIADIKEVNSLAGFFTTETLQSQTPEKTGRQTQEVTQLFTSDMIQKNDAIATDNKLSFTELPPPIYIRKNKK